MRAAESGPHAKDGIACPVCGGDVPPSRGFRPRKYCSAKCCAKAKKGVARRNREPHFCAGCGVLVPYSGRGPRSNLKCQQCKKAAEKQRRRNSAKPRKCERCGVSFLAIDRKRYCSPRCQHDGVGKKHGDLIQCKRCGKAIRKDKPDRVYCSIRCRNDRAKKYNCLNCGVEFQKKRYESGAYSCQKKYCSRECAFEARRLKKPCAERPLEIAGKLARWFLAWGDDQWPLTASCPGCGDSFCRQKQAGGEIHEKCLPCRSVRSRPCPGCGCILDGGRRLCVPCAAKRLREQRRKGKLSHRKKHGNACTARRRCKKYGAPYTKVSRDAVMARDDWRCQLCGVALLRSFTTIEGTRTPHPRTPTIDHIVPLSFGPTSPGHVFDNCQAACWACNCERGAEDADSFARRKATR